MSLNKKGYFQGGGGVNEPKPGEKKYKSDPAIVVQPRFKEPFYRNYDLYTIPGMEHIGPGTGWHGLQNYKSTKEFLEARRERLKPRYVADDSWITDSGEHVKKNPERKARMAILEKIIKSAGSNYDLGKGLYQEMSDGKVDSVEEFREEGNHGPGAFHTDDNDIDFPIDDMVNRQDQMIYPEEDEYQIRREKGDKYQFPSEGSPLDPEELNISMTTPQIAGEHSYLPDPDFEGKSDNGSQLDFGRDYTEETPPGRDFAFDDDKQMDLDDLESKYLESTETGIFGLPDGVDPEGHDPEETVDGNQTYKGISDISRQMYEDKWNI
jgi:hypothetical protein